jgi:hypothetical protein
MPPLPPVPNTARIRIGYSIGADTSASSRLFYSYTGGPPTAPNLTTWATAVFTALGPLAAYMNSDKIFTSVTIQDLGSDLGLEGVATGVTPGTIAGHTLDAEACTVFEHSIARHYRGGKPKCFMPFGDSEDLASEQTWAGTYLAAVGASWNTFLAAIVAGAAAIEVPVHQVNVSYYQGSSAYDVGSGAYIRGKTRLTPRAGGPITDPVIASVPRARVGSQRRRLLASG